MMVAVLGRDSALGAFLRNERAATRGRRKVRKCVDAYLRCWESTRELVDLTDEARALTLCRQWGT